MNVRLRPTGQSELCSESLEERAAKTTQRVNQSLTRCVVLAASKPLASCCCSRACGSHRGCTCFPTSAFFTSMRFFFFLGEDVSSRPRLQKHPRSVIFYGIAFLKFKTCASGSSSSPSTTHVVCILYPADNKLQCRISSPLEESQKRTASSPDALNRFSRECCF